MTTLLPSSRTFPKQLAEPSYIQDSLGLLKSDHAEISSLLRSALDEDTIGLSINVKAPLALLNACPLMTGVRLRSAEQASAVLDLSWLSALRAVHILGHRVAKTAVSCDLDLHGVFHPLWRQTLTLSFASELLARVSRKASPQSAWLAGLTIGLAGLNLSIRFTESGQKIESGQPIQLTMPGIDGISQHFGFQDLLPTPESKQLGKESSATWNVAATAANLLQENAADTWVLRQPSSLQTVALSPVVQSEVRLRLLEVEKQSVATSNALWQCPLRATTS